MSDQEGGHGIVKPEITTNFQQLLLLLPVQENISYCTKTF